MPRAISRSSSSAPLASATAVEVGAKRAELGRRDRLRRAQLQHQKYQPLLGAVVQVSLDAPARLIGGGDDPRATWPSSPEATDHWLSSVMAPAIARAGANIAVAASRCATWASASTTPCDFSAILEIK
jgi:hypothetical protein